MRTGSFKIINFPVGEILAGGLLVFGIGVRSDPWSGLVRALKDAPTILAADSL